MKSSLSILPIIITALLQCVNFSDSQFSKSLNCPAVPDRTAQNVEIRCRNSYGADANCTSPFAPGSTVQFNCPKYFVVKNGTNFYRMNKEIMCSMNGKWSEFQNFMKFACVPECGKYIEVTGSSEGVAPPWQAIILKNRRRESCDGTLIPSLVGNTSVILTSRDCITSGNGTKLLNKDLRVSIVREDSVREFLVKSVFVPSDPKSNLAILNLSTPVVLSKNVLPICLPFGDSPMASLNQPLTPGTVGIILNTETIWTDLSVLSPEKCAEGFGYSPEDTEFCTIKVSEESPAFCPSVDGPFLLKDSNSSKFVSYGAFGVQSGNLRVNSCQLGIIFTKISSFQNWISEVLREISGIKDSPTKPVCEDGWTWTRDSKNVNAECKPVLGVQKANQVRTTESPRNRSTTTLTSHKPVTSVTTCPPLIIDEADGFKIECEYNNRAVNCLQERPSVGTTVLYKCDTFYNPPTVGSSLTNKVCQPNGMWTTLRRDFTCTLTCGEEVLQSSTGSENRKPEARKIRAGKWPWVVALYQEDPPGSGRFKFTCGGTLVSRIAVITAAQCVTQRSSTRPRNSTNMRIVMGKYFRDFETRHSAAQERNVKAINVHGDYRPFSLDNDIAVIFLDKPVRITEGVHPVCLPNMNDDALKFGDVGTMAGWGRTKNGQFPNEMNQIDIPIASTETCTTADELLLDIVRPPKNFCAGYLNESLPTACDEDEGSGLYFQGTQRPRTWKLLGITSAVLKRVDGHCRRDIYSVFTNVSTFRPWLDTILDKDLSRAF